MGSKENIYVYCGPEINVNKTIQTFMHSSQKQEKIGGQWRDRNECKKKFNYHCSDLTKQTTV